MRARPIDSEVLAIQKILSEKEKIVSDIMLQHDATWRLRMHTSTERVFTEYIVNFMIYYIFKNYFPSKT